MEKKVTNRKAKQRVKFFSAISEINDFLERNPDHRVTQMCMDEEWIYVVFDIEEKVTFTYKVSGGGREL